MAARTELRPERQITSNSVSAVAPPRLRKRVEDLSSQEISDLRGAFSALAADRGENGYAAIAGIYGAPRNFSVHHDQPRLRSVSLFLPWNRMFLVTFERALARHAPELGIPWWDWSTSTGSGIPAAFSTEKIDGKTNPLASMPIDRALDGPTRTSREPGNPKELPSADLTEQVLKNTSFNRFSARLEDLHDQ